MRSLICLCVAVVMYCPLTVAAQAAAAPGDRIRLKSRDGAVRVGVLSALNSESIILRQAGGGQEISIPLSEATELERSLGSTRTFGSNFGLTVALSAATGGLLYGLTWSPCRETGFLACFLEPDSRTEAFAWGLAGGAIVGVPLGVITGLAIRREQWEPVPVPGIGGAGIVVVPIVGRRFGVVGSIALGGS